MAVNPIQFLVATNASITDGTKTITVSGNVDCSRVYSGTAVFLGGTDNPAEAISGTAPDGSGNSTITLRNNWSQGDVINQQLVSFNTNEGLAEAISNVREIVSNVSAIEDLATQGLIKRISDNVYEVVNISAIGESLITASDASSQRSVLGLGSAATKNVGTSSGNVMEVTSTAITDFNNITIDQGFLWADPSAANLPTGAGTNNWAGIHVERFNTTYFDFWAGLTENRYFARAFNNGNKNWVEFYTSGNSVNPLDYGLGGATTSASLITDFSLNEQSGFYRSLGGYTDAPETLTFNASVIAYPASTGTNFLYQRNVSTPQDIKAWLGCTRPQTNDVAWVELYHSGNFVNPLDYGIKSAKRVPNDNLDTATESGFFYGYSGAHPSASAGDNPFPTGSGSFALQVIGQFFKNPSEYTLQVATSIGANATSKFRTIASSGAGWSPWVEYLHSGNTNFNEFGGTGAGKRIAKGTCRGTTSAFIELPLNGNTDATSISVTGTFKITDHTGTNVLVSGIPAANFSLTNTKPSNKFFTVLVNVAGGLTGQAPIYLETESSDAKIFILQ